MIFTRLGIRVILLCRTEPCDLFGSRILLARTTPCPSPVIVTKGTFAALFWFLPARPKQ